MCTKLEAHAASTSAADRKATNSSSEAGATELSAGKVKRDQR